MSGKNTLFICVVETPEGEDVFIIRAQFSSSRDERLIDPEFYEEWCKPGQIPYGDHYELEVFEPRVWEHEYAGTGIIHVHLVPGTNRKFVCWTASLPTLDAVEPVLTMWCVGTSFTMVTGEDFGPLFGENPDTFPDRMKARGFTVQCQREE